MAVYHRPRPKQTPGRKGRAEAVMKRGFRSVGFESGHLTVGDWETLRELTPAVAWKASRDPVEKLRAIKDPSEVAQIREAIAIAERAFEAFRALLRPEDS